MQIYTDDKNLVLPKNATPHYFYEILFATALIVGSLSRIIYGRGMPLWLDETFTGTIASQPTSAGLLRWTLSELTGPVYYGSMWIWVQLFGSSTEVLRTPSLICSLAAPLLIYWCGHPDKKIRVLWGSIALLWLPIITFSNDARPYPLLFLLGCLQAIAFWHLVRAPRTSAALAWASLTSVLILTHYGALAISGVQGIAYLLLHRHRALATWPAVLVFLPVIGWMVYHVPFVLSVTGGGLATSTDGTFSALSTIPATLFGTTIIGLMLISTIVVTLIIDYFKKRLIRIVLTPDIVLAGTGIVACSSMTILAVGHPGILPRYITPSVPAMLFGVALWLRWILRIDIKPAMIVLGIMISSTTATLWSAVVDHRVDAQHHFALEPASLWLMKRSPRRLIFLWTDWSAAVAPTRNLMDLAGFEFRREGHPVEVWIVRPVSGQDASSRARAAAGNDPDTVIILLANDRDTLVPTVSHIDAQDPRWECQEFGNGYVTANACRRRVMTSA